MSQDSSTPKKSDKPKFLPQHIEYLRARKIPIEYAIKAGVESFKEPSSLVANFLKRRFKGLCVYPSSGLLTPYLVEPLDGINRARIRWDLSKRWKGTPGADEHSTKIPRYTAQEGVSVIPYYPPGLLKPGVQDEPTVALFIVEAPMKALSLTANGFPAIGMAGVEAGAHDTQEWKTSKHLAINKELDRVFWKGRTVYVTYDAGIQINPRVALGAAKLAHVLQAREAEVRLVILPLLHTQERTLDDLILYGNDDQGPDDFLAKQGIEAFQALVDQAVVADPIVRVKTIIQAQDLDKDTKRDQVAKLLQDLTFVAALDVGGRVVVDQVAAIIKTTGIKARALQDQVGKLLLRLDKDNGAAGNEATKLPYVIDNGRIAMTTLVGGIAVTKYLADFTAEIIEEIMTDDGMEKTCVYKLEGKLPDGKTLPSIEVAASEFAKLDWTAQWGSKALVRAEPRNAKDHTRAAIQGMSKPTQATVYTHLGWCKIDGQLVYLHPGGAIGADDLKVRVNVTTKRGKFGFPDTVVNLKEAVRLSLSLLHVGPLEVTLPVLAATYTAVLSELLEIDFGIWIVGQSGSYKSTLAAKGMSHYGTFDFNSLPTNWFSTGGAIEMALFMLKDALIVIDNYVPAPTQQGHQRLAEVALRIIQCIGDRSARGRLDRNLDERANRPPRGLSVMTGEDLPPTNESTLGRLIVLDVKKGDLKLDRLAAIQDHAEQLPHAMRGFIEWIALKLKSGGPAIQQLRRETAASYRAQLAASNPHERTANSLAALATGFGMFLDFAHELGVIDADHYDQLHSQADEALLRIGRKQKSNVEGMKPTERYISSLRSLLVQGRVVLAAKDAQLDKYTTSTTKAIGWQDGDHVYLVPDLAWEVIEQFNAKAGWNYTKTDLHRRLAEIGVIHRKDASDDGESRLTVRETLGGKSQRVFKLDKKHFEEAIPDPERTRMQKATEEAQRQDERNADLFEVGIAVEEYGAN